MRSPGWIGNLVISLVLLAATPGLMWAHTGGGGDSIATPTAPPLAQKLYLSGVDNFGRVNEHLYRGAQPGRFAYAGLKSAGIDTVVKLNGDDATAEKRLVEAQGMRFISLPWSGEGLPSHEQVVAFLTLMHDHPDYHVFIHCKVGADRTGVMVALYRMEFDHWTTSQAVSEMFQFHYHHMFLPHLERYVQGFPAAMNTDAALRFPQPPLAEPPVAVLVH